ncbi:MAG: hypothetical protein D6735_15705 [Acidobacteria bacterium]|nr:MAG: hypothetical protein D6735_15705 [Acidobacteriota bacterium]
MAKFSKLQRFRHIVASLDWDLFLPTILVAIVILSACVPPLSNWHMFCLVFIMPIVLIILALTIWRAVKTGTEVAKYFDNHEKREGL